MIALFHDYASPASAVAALRLQRLADEGAAVEFHGFEPLPADAPHPVTLEVIADIARLAGAAADEGLELRRPPALPSTGLAHALGTLAHREGLGASWRQTCYRAVWERGADIGDPSILAELTVRAGLDAAAAQRALGDSTLLATVRRRMAAHRRTGIGGVPTISSQGTLIPGLLAESELRALAAL